MSQTIPRYLKDQLVSETVTRLDQVRSMTNDQQVLRFLDYLASRIFEPSLAVTTAYRKCELQRRSFVPRFHSAVGDRPKEYIQSLRIDAGRVLLRKTSCSLEAIGKFLGFASGKAFSESFINIAGERPSFYRSRTLDGEKKTTLTSGLYANIRQNSLNEEQAIVLQDYLHTHHANIAGQPPKIHFSPSNESYTTQIYSISTSTLERLRAEKMWSEIRNLPLDQQRLKVKYAESFETPELFYFLKKKAIEIGREDRSKGVKLMFLSLEAARATETPDLSGRSSLWAQAYSHLANAQRLNFELEAADHSFRLAQLYAPCQSEPNVLGEVLYLGSALRWYQKKPQAGLQLVDSSISLLKSTGDLKLLAKAYLHKGILLRAVDNIEEARYSDERALELINEETQPVLTCTARYNLALSLYKMDKPDDVIEELESLRRVNEYVNSKHFRLHADWLEGRIWLDRNQPVRAEKLLYSSHNGFCLIKSKISALVGLDLSIAFFLQRKVGKARSLAVASLPVLYRFKGCSKFAAAIEKIERAARTKMFTLEEIVEVRDLSQGLLEEPATRREMSFTGIL